MTSSRYLLDTNILSDLVRHPQGIVAQRIKEAGEAAVCTSIIVAAELRFGVVKKNSLNLTRQVEAILAAIEVLPLDTPADYAYAQFRWKLEQSGKIIGPNDMLIAAQAMASQCVLITANLDEFSRIEELQIENWLTK
ncbi:type II toxin-antitoxin system VapC family toxin [Nitrosomonas sp.]|uniref:type II toxin-antitoxin system VapC family toxin n=1 Tax=Nitrosomonas sp. TaxID=42353 RepID=UPI0025F80982|nr:type II toxin-antitoxin system VapC family toxin [Nitrosomonas sp.]